MEDDIEFFSSVASLNTPVAANDPESMSLINFVADESAESPSHAAETTLLRERLEKVIDAFPQRTRTIFLMRFGLEPYPREYTLEEIGQKVGLTRERVRQILNKGFQSMALHNRSLKR